LHRRVSKRKEAKVKGYRIVPEDQADAIAFVHAATRDKHTYQVFYDGWPGWGWRFGWAAPIVEEYDFTVGSLIVDIFDASMKRAIWHGSATDVVLGDPEHDARKIQQAITKLLQRFPPRTRNTSAPICHRHISPLRQPCARARRGRRRVDRASGNHGLAGHFSTPSGVRRPQKRFGASLRPPSSSRPAANCESN
jgi:hypothetical protein